jgi:hypothetical protein
MDWNHKIEQQWDVLQRIVVLLFALAELADEASTCSRRVRHKMMSILLRGETVARNMLSREVQIFGKPVCLPARPCDDRVEDAMQLAHCFRAMAAALAYIISAKTQPVRRHAPCCPLRSDRPSNTARKIRHAHRGVGFRALDSPFFGGG